MARSPLRINLLSIFNNKGVREAQKDLRSLGRSVESLGGSALKAAAGFAVFTVGTRFVDFVGQATSEASDLVRNMNGLESVFGSMTPVMKEFVDQAYLMGLSQNEAAKASTFLGSVIKQSGFDIETTSKLTKELVALGTDLSIVYGYDVQEALLGMTALFRGEYDPIEKFGVAMKQNEIETEKQKRQLDGLTGAQERFADQLIRLEFLFERSADAQGAFRAQVGTLFVEQQILEAQLRNIAAEVGGPLLQSFGQLIQVFRPLIDELTPMLTGLFSQLIVVVQSLIENKEKIIDKFIQFAGVVSFLSKVFIGATLFVLEHIDAISRVIVALGILFAVTKTIAVLTTIWGGVTAAVTLAAGAVRLLNANLYATIAAIKGIRTVLITTGVGALLVGLGFAAEFVISKFTDTAEALGGVGDEAAMTQAEIDKMLEALDADRVEGFAQASQEEIKQILADARFTGESLMGPGGSSGAGAAARDGVKTFYANLASEAEKQKAKLRLEQLGATPALIESILGSGDQWRQVFNSVVANGKASVDAVQRMFMATAAGYQEAMAKWEEEVLRPFEEFKRAAEDARDALLDFTNEFRILPSIESDLGKFESAVVNLLEGIEEKLDAAFDNGHLLEESYKNLQEYARNELATLRQIERQRDEILERRDAAQRLIEEVQDSVRSSANLVNLLRDIQREAEKVDVLAFTREALSASGELRQFSVAIMSNFVDPIKQARANSDKLVQGFRGVVERTREYVENLKALRALGLDPMLFNQLVEAGVEAGGETAKALVEGGSETITEINRLFKELDTLGAELGENTAQVMFGQGQKFVNGIVEGLADQANELETSAKTLAEAFTTTFEEVLVAGIERAIAAAEAAMRAMPQMPDFDFNFPTGGGGGGGGGATGGMTGGRVTPAPTPPLADTLFNAITKAAQAAPKTLIPPSYAPMRVDRPETPIYAGRGGLLTSTNVSIYTSSTPSSVANSIARYATVNTPTRVGQAVSSRTLKSKPTG